MLNIVQILCTQESTAQDQDDPELPAKRGNSRDHVGYSQVVNGQRQLERRLTNISGSQCDGSAKIFGNEKKGSLHGSWYPYSITGLYSYSAGL